MKTVALDDLPSRGKLIPKDKYPQLNIQRLSLKQMQLFSTAVSKSSPEAFVEAIRTSVNVPLNYLTVGDFYYVVTYLRCSLRTPLSLSWTCDGFWYHTKDNQERISAPDAKRLMMDPEFKDQTLVPVSCGTDNTQVYRLDDIPVVYLPEQEIVLGEDFEIPNATLLPEYMRLVKDHNMAQLLPGLQWVKHGRTLKEKLEWVAAQGERDVDILDEGDQYNHDYAHGPSNMLIAECRCCKTAVRQRISLGAESFFRQT